MLYETESRTYTCRSFWHCVPKCLHPFIEITNAYQVLGNVSSRKKYDEEFGSYFNFQGSFKKEAIRPTWRLFDSRIVNIDAKNIKQVSFL